MAEIKQLEDIASQVRRDVIRQTHFVNSGHPGASLGCADFMTALYFEIMEHDASFEMSGKNEDIFFLSNGHISPLWYSVLARSGYFSIDELATFRRINHRLQGHPAVAENLPGIRIASGSLGQGISVAIGAAIAKKMDNDDKLVFVLTGDGELQEGQIWEAALYAPFNKVDNLIVVVDWNGQQIDGTTDQVLALTDLEGKWKSFGWEVLEMQGNNMKDVVKQLNKAKSLAGNGKPIIILMKTEMGYGVDFMEGVNTWHGKTTDIAQTADALSQLKETLGDYKI